MCRYPHCTCISECVYGGEIPKRDPKTPLFKREHLRELADRHDLANTIDDHPGFHLKDEDMKAIAFALRFTAEKL
jgi:hypothetical protein